MNTLDQKGFSLLELLIVCCIVALLAGMAVPKVSQIMASSRSARIAADLTTLDAAIVMYQTDKGTNPTKVSELSSYVSDAEKLTPPKGKCMLQDNKIIEITAETYDIAAAKSSDGTSTTEEIRAQCAGHTARDFSR